MYPIMKNTIGLISLFFFIGCSFVTQSDYTYKTRERYPIFTESDVEKNPVIGVAMLSDTGAHDTTQIKNGIYKFMRHKNKEVLKYEILFPNIGSEISIDENRHITNIGYILHSMFKCNTRP